jgi:hypothetical protein
MIQDLEPTWEQELLTRGAAAGELQAYRSLLQTLLQQRFGALQAELLQRLEHADLATLQNTVTRLHTLTALTDLQL